ncbi:hypothetical protein Y032_0633g887 [Ancylostoma ceylanicum]|nr:hypothetical protein Y032_0633g887 [Ancylostoma ceylanicum]
MSKPIPQRNRVAAVVLSGCEDVPAKELALNQDDREYMLYQTVALKCTKSTFPTMSAFSLITLLSLIPTLISALKCHQVATANLSNPPETQATECIAGSLACTKLVDYTTKTFTKQCQQFNCTAGSLMNAPAQCTNTSQLGRESVSCCCYGDGCNSAPTSPMWMAFTAMAAIVFGKGIIA